jgi:hypothetical protein
MTGVRARLHALADWAGANVTRTRGAQVMDRADAAEIDWSDDRAAEPVTTASST